jgi:hypothetical protein
MIHLEPTLKNQSQSMLRFIVKILTNILFELLKFHVIIMFFILKQEEVRKFINTP